MYGHWEVDTDFDPNKYFGVVYIITNILSGQAYIGKKQFRFRKRKKIKGKKNRKVIIKDSDWKEYTSSSDELNEDIQRLGKENFRFQFLKLCETKRELSYTEVAEQFRHDVLNAKLPNGERAFYNRNIMNRFFVASTGRNHSKETIEKIRQGNLGKKLSEETKNKISNFQRGRPKSEEHKQKMRDARKKSYNLHKENNLGSNNPMFGKQQTDEAKQKMSKARKLYWEQRKNAFFVKSWITT